MSSDLGAHPKDDWYEEDKFTSPLNSQCEIAFRFNFSGEIQAIKDDISAQTTIEKLKLDNPELTELRQKVIESTILNPLLSLEEAKTLLKNIYQRDSKNKFRPFCFVLKQACEEYIRRLEKA